MPPACRLILIAGVSGSGKTTIGTLLARDLGWEFHDADDYHSKENVAKMASGIPLDDADREPWLAALRSAMEACLREGRGAVFACSALKKSYRRSLLGGLEGAGLVFLQGDFDLIRARMEARPGHYMQAGMLRSQFEAVEPPGDALIVDVRADAPTSAGIIRRHFAL